MDDQYDAAQAQVAELKRQYAAHLEEKKMQRKPLMHVICGLCLLAIAWLMLSAVGPGLPIVLTALACVNAYMAYQHWSKHG